MNTFGGFVDIMGSSQTKFISAMVDVVSNNKATIWFHKGNNPEDKLNESEKINYIPKVVSGIITDNVNNVEVPISNARITFLINNTIIDYTTTDANGKYSIFIEPGNYTIRLDTGSGSRTFTNQIIEDGLTNQYFFTVESLIKSRHDDIVEFNGTDYKLINGVIVDQIKQPVVNAEIIITDPITYQILTYVKTNEFGKYSFAIPNGIYDVRIRTKNKPIKIAKNFEFNQGFISKLNLRFNSANNDKLIII